MKLTKQEDITVSKSKKSSFSLFKKISNIFSFFCNIFASIKIKINSFLSKYPITIQFSIILIPMSIVIIIFIFLIHYYFYSDLYVFNFSKVFKDEFLDLYITKIEDLKAELTSIMVKETKIDIENQLFFQVYFKELSKVGLMNQSKNFFPSFSDNPGSTSLYSKLNYINKVDARFNIPEDIAKNKIEERIYDKLGDFAKIYYYMFPHIWYESLLTNTLINQSFFLAYEFGEITVEYWWSGEEKIINGVYNEFLFFRYPIITDEFDITNNFIPNNYRLNPYVQYEEYDNFFPLDNFFPEENWFKAVDYIFRSSINITNDECNNMANISFAHLNVESDGRINKTFITYSQQCIEYNNRYFIINIFFYYNQANLRDKDIDYTILIAKDNFTGILPEENTTYRFSDNFSFVSSVSDLTEYSLSDLDYTFFHLGLKDIHNDFCMNGILYDTFNLEYFSNYSRFYSFSKKREFDLKFYTTLYLYKSLFQNIEYTKVIKNRDEIFLYNFKGDKIKQICEKIDFDSYKNYLSDSGIDCFDERTKRYYNKEKYIYLSLENDTNVIYPNYPYCGCLPLFCFKNYENLDENLDNLEFVDEINLPNKCQNKFLNYISSTRNSENSKNNKNNNLLNISSNEIDYAYVKFISFELDQLPGYFLFIIAQIRSTGEVYIHTYYKKLTEIEIIILVFFVLFIVSLLSIIIIYINMKKYSLIISNFKNKFEFYIFNSENEDETYSNNDDLSEDKKDEQIINYFNINENNLLDELFSIFSQTYNVCRKDIEKLYSSKKNKSKNQMKLEMMIEKNELFELLSTFSLYAPSFKLNLNFDYNLYEYSTIIKKYNNYFRQLENYDIKQIRLTENLLIELISTECINDYGLITNFNFEYITNIKSDSKKNSIKYTIFENIKNLNDLEEENKLKEENVKKLVLKRKNVLLDIFKNKLESDDYLNYNKLNSAFNFFLVNSYYKYSKQISL